MLSVDTLKTCSLVDLKKLAKALADMPDQRELRQRVLQAIEESIRDWEDTVSRVLERAAAGPLQPEDLEGLDWSHLRELSARFVVNKHGARFNEHNQMLVNRRMYAMGDV